MRPAVASRLLAAVGEAAFAEWPTVEMDMTTRHVAATLSELLHAMLGDEPARQDELVARLRRLAEDDR